MFLKHHKTHLITKQTELANKPLRSPLWRLRRVGGAADTGVPPLEGRGSGRRCQTRTCSTSEHTSGSGSGGIHAQNLVVIGWSIRIVTDEHCDRPISVNGYVSSLFDQTKKTQVQVYSVRSASSEAAAASAAIFRGPPPCPPEQAIRRLEGDLQARGEVARVCGVRVLCDIESLHLPSSMSGATEKARLNSGDESVAADVADKVPCCCALPQVG